MATVVQVVRLALTGTSASTEPDATDIGILARGATVDLIARYPDCLTGATLTEDDFLEAVGYLVASRIVTTPGGGKFAQFVMSVKVHATTETRQNPAQTAAEAQQVLVGLSDVALFRIACVQVEMEGRNSGALFSLSGRRRSLNESRGCS